MTPEFAKVVTANVSRNAQQPGFEVASPKATNTSPGRQKGILSGIFGCMRIA
jgi:hypothetical protein